MMSYFTSISSPQTKEVPSTQILNEPIAIISMSCRLPGEVFSPEDFWSMLHSGKDCVSTIPFSRFDMDQFYDPERGTIGKTYTNKAALIKDIEWFDYEFFNISLAEASVMDPQHRILLEVSFEAFSRAGYEKSSLKGSNIGVYVGQCMHDWMTMIHKISSPYIAPGSSAAITANRISYIFGLSGPSMSVDTACSSSLVAMDSAISHLRLGKCSCALVAGVNFILSP